MECHGRLVHVDRMKCMAMYGAHLRRRQNVRVSRLYKEPERERSRRRVQPQMTFLAGDELAFVPAALCRETLSPLWGRSTSRRHSGRTGLACTPSSRAQRATLLMRKVDEAPKASKSAPEIVDATPANESVTVELGEKLQKVLESIEKIPEAISKKIANFDVEKFSRDSAAYWKRVLDNTVAGEWFNRGETYVVIQLALILLILRDPGALDPVFGFLMGPVPLFLGIYVVVQAIRELGPENFVPWVKPPASAALKTDGLYGLMRHPIYTGIVLTSFGFSTVSHSPERLVLTLALFYFFTRKATEEEKYLIERFGKEYEEYAARVKAFIPNVF